MHKKILFIIFCLCSYYGNACDICGCAIGGNYLGIVPQFSKNLIGLQTNYASFKSKHSSLQSNDALFDSKEFFYQNELFGRFWISNRLQAMAFLPYNVTHKNEHNQNITHHGMGDLRFLGQYTLFNTADSLYKQWRFSWIIGAGFSMPTGNTFLKNEAGTHPSLAPGSGNWATNLQSVAVVRKAKVGLLAEANYRHGFSTVTNYLFGDRLSAAARLFWWERKNLTSWVPASGFFFEWAGYDLDNGFRNTFSGGSATFCFVALQTFFPKWAISSQFAFPIHANLGQQLVKPQNSFSFQINFLINQKK